MVAEVIIMVGVEAIITDGATIGIGKIHGGGPVQPNDPGDRSRHSEHFFGF